MYKILLVVNNNNILSGVAMKTTQPLGIKIKRIRKSLKISREQFAKLVGIPFTTLKNYELMYRNVSATLLVNIATHPELHKYALWLVSDEINPSIGQIEPPELPVKNKD